MILGFDAAAAKGAVEHVGLEVRQHLVCEVRPVVWQRQSAAPAPLVTAPIDALFPPSSRRDPNACPGPGQWHTFLRRGGPPRLCAQGQHGAAAHLHGAVVVRAVVHLRGPGIKQTVFEANPGRLPTAGVRGGSSFGLIRQTSLGNGR